MESNSLDQIDQRLNEAIERYKESVKAHTDSNLLSMMLKNIELLGKIKKQLLKSSH